MDRCSKRTVGRIETPRRGWGQANGSPVRMRGSSAARKCSNQTDLRLTLADLFYGSDLPERPSPTFMRLVCIQKVVHPTCRIR
jgi:hypothetical protein